MKRISALSICSGWFQRADSENAILPDAGFSFWAGFTFHVVNPVDRGIGQCVRPLSGGITLFWQEKIRPPTLAKIEYPD
ncbi:MAG: hypothetical protein IV101_03110 [Dechloromonas sp.]|nr:hypothetical protein [Dechloromonas sp.]